MQLYALDQEQKPIFALRAQKHQDYYCSECLGVVRLRSGMHRRPHFFHLTHNINCNQSGKSMSHLQVQYFFLRQLPENDCFIEYRFPTINRIADVFWKSQGIVFEIQCSFITATEIENRCKAYESLGLSVVWVLHDKSFNQKRISAAEMYLKNSPHYFTNMNAEGDGIIYDQLGILNRGQKIKCLLPLEIDVREKKLIPEFSRPILGENLKGRLLNWPHYFAGDFIDNCLQSQAYCEQVLQEELRFIKKPKKQNLKTLFGYLFKPYLQVFKLLIEKACR